MRINFPSPKIIVALDFSTAEGALQLVEKLNPQLCRLRVGKELFTAAGPELVRQLIAKGFPVFLDLKFHDIPNTVAKACKAAAELGVWMLNVHASGGSAMLQAARTAIDSCVHRPLLVGVTVLTSMQQQDLCEINVQNAVVDQVTHLAQLAYDAGLDGVVCSAHEAQVLRQKFGSDFCLVVPGIRPAGVDAADQKRVATPEQALRAGANYLVMGRAIIQASDPVSMLTQINLQSAIGT